LSGELNVVVGNDRIMYPKTDNDILDKIYSLLRADLARGFPSTHLVNLSTMTSRWVKPPGAFLKAPKKIQTPYYKQQSVGIIWSSRDGTWTCLAKNWHPLQDLTTCVASLAAVGL
jgi:hypothetical protein